MTVLSTVYLQELPRTLELCMYTRQTVEYPSRQAVDQGRETWRFDGMPLEVLHILSWPAITLCHMADAAQKASCVATPRIVNMPLSFFTTRAQTTHIRPLNLYFS